MLTVGSLFSGIGGLDLGLERAGMQVIWQSEIDPYASRVLARHWPDVPNLGDIKQIDWNSVERPDLICGGYPCQPFSLAGARGGAEDPRHLWPFMRNALHVLRPRLVLLENVPGHLSLGFGRVLGDLAELGYDCEWDCIPAAAVGAPHLRYRVFVVAHTNSESQPGQPSDERRALSGPMVPDTDSRRVRQQSVRLAGSDCASVAPGDGETSGVADTYGEIRQPREIERSLGRGGLSRNAWRTEPDMGRVAHGVPNRVDRLKCLGNAVVPQVAEWIGRRIMEAAA